MLFLTFVVAFALLVGTYAEYPKVRVELYYEALCPGKKHLFRVSLLMIFKMDK